MSTELRGVPVQLDSVLRPLARVVQLGVALPLTLAATVLGGWLWAPLPLALSFLVYEAFFFLRGDRPCRVQLGDTLVLVDPVRGQRLEIEPSDVTSAAVLRTDGLLSVRLCDELGIAFACRVEAPGSPSIDSVDYEPLLGPASGSIRALGPNERVCRQTLRDPKGQLLAWLQARVQAAAWERTEVRLWQGEAPDLDVFALHKGEPDAHLVVTANQYVLGDRRGPIRRVSLSWAARQAVLLRPGEGQLLQAHDIPLLVLGLDEDLAVAIPAAREGLPEGRSPVAASTFHTHQVEGILLIDHLRRALSPDVLPQALVRATLPRPAEPE